MESAWSRPRLEYQSMKINIAFREAEREKAVEVIEAVRELYPDAKVKQTDLKDEYRHAYIVINKSTAGNG